ncbi:MAG TPA: sigma-54 dependent transcriptional regulator [Woeseiaceae bacterium]|nr:sigma-54 dependent transcriptional regulator [Woeseiaceae bacterium]
MTDAGVLIVEDDADLLSALEDTLGGGGFPVYTADNGHAALSILERRAIGLVVSDVQMSPMSGTELLREIRRRHPSLPAILMTAYGTIEHAVGAMREGASDYLVKPFEAEALRELVERHLHALPAGDGPVASDPRSKELLDIARRVAASNATVMVSGESGSGKEVIARYVHAHSKRRERPFVAINCAAIPENMLEAVLFGYEKGAFTGAVAAHAGKFEQANGGTLLLDEISEMELGLQAKLLRVLQEREVERIGGSRTISLDVRVLATTNRDLRQHVAEGRFREDLYYRLNVFPLHVPPLRERPGDIVPLAERAIVRFADGAGSLPRLGEDAAARLVAHDWPGNVRELENLIQRALILRQGPTITAQDLVFESPAEAMPAPANEGLLQDGLKEREWRLILDALRAAGGSRAAAAERLGISPRTLRYKLARMREAGVRLPDEGGTRTTEGTTA